MSFWKRSDVCIIYVQVDVTTELLSTHPTTCFYVYIAPYFRVPDDDRDFGRNASDNLLKQFDKLNSNSNLVQIGLAEKQLAMKPF